MRNKLLAALAIVVLAAASGGVWAYHKSQDDPSFFSGSPAIEETCPADEAPEAKAKPCCCSE